MTNKAILKAVMKLLKGLAANSKTNVDYAIVAHIEKLLENKVY